MVLTTGLTIGARAERRDAVIRANLRGLNEVPPVASQGSATLRATFDQSAQTITFTIDYKNLSGPPAAAHTHFGPTKVNGGVMFFFCGGGGKPACPATPSGTITATVTPADVVGPTAQGITAGDFADVVRAIASGNSYANIHTAAFPGGEIRGRLVAFGIDSDEDQDD
ncbi:MAG TPA: CHRD domain-containing protein [Kofleriaceae bacterium]|nr:CHRD domain-containing protein [Kofleriaceae bacterium]